MAGGQDLEEDACGEGNNLDEVRIRLEVLRITKGQGPKARARQMVMASCSGRRDMQRREEKATGTDERRERWMKQQHDRGQDASVSVIQTRSEKRIGADRLYGYVLIRHTITKPKSPTVSR
ncbi:hypothetical protein CVT25_010168 [Psilocybe cyanescens]|uniref:Uncharacterized protein n=1 Tax=Psilocybe cyanescens TaxID=93625 RepID=A0A409XJ61_PSICY|nr:hypothetical protein CVT25_010168 [Psilocybe cyanescens]